MCGVAGFLDRRGLTAADGRERARRMAATLRHRGPDDEDVWTDGASVALGFRRLAILELSPLGRQPMPSASGRYVAVFNGEIYNFKTLREELIARGQRFRGGSDTEVLLACIEEYGFETTLARIRGMFAIAVWDTREKTLSLARDRLGEKPLYYGWAKNGSTFLFASELKAIRAHPDFVPEIDRAALMRFIRHGYVPSPHAIYVGIQKLRPGAWLRVPIAGDAKPEQTPYYSLTAVAEDGLAHPLDVGIDEAADLLEETLRRAVREQMIADVPLGAFLSGGIDSSLIVLLMQSMSSTPVRTFSIGFDTPKFDESAYARRVADLVGTQHTEFRVSADDALGLIPELPTIYDEPFADSSQIPTTLVSRLARREVTVSLTGDGGDELFAGYPRYAVMRTLEPLFSVPGRRVVAEAAHRVVELMSRDGIEATFDRRATDWARRRTDVARTPDLDAFYELYMSLWYHPDWVVHGVAEPSGIMPLAKDVLARGNVTERAMLVDTIQNLPDALLTKVDRAAMSASLETRLPLLDRDVVSLAWRLPFATKVRGRVGKLVMRRILGRSLPADLFDRPKMGFMIPVVDWLRGPLRDWAEDLLDERRLREDGYLDAEIIRRRWHGFLAGTRDWHGLLWPVLMWQAWRASVR
jgi:asparagine synthase (glutamine-hydrolysing)